MTTTHIVTPEYLEHMKDTPEIVRVGIMAPLDREKEINLCSRWTEPFIERDIEVVRIPVGASKGGEALRHVDGLLMPGGDSHVHPLFYDSHDIIEGGHYDPERDDYALGLLQKAYTLNLPTLGVCRGMQEMVVAFEGQLKQLSKEGGINHARGYEAVRMADDGRRCFEGMDDPVHEINLLSGGHLARIFNKEQFLVNSIHEQGISRDQWEALEGTVLTRDFRIEAIAPDGVIEAISARKKTFYLGVQPHYELPGPQHRGVYDEFERHIRAHHALRTGNLSIAHETVVNDFA